MCREFPSSIAVTEKMCEQLYSMNIHDKFVQGWDGDGDGMYGV